MELLEELPLELFAFPLWCEELYDEDVLLPFLPFSFELELLLPLLRAFSGVLSRSSCLGWYILSGLLDSPEALILREVDSAFKCDSRLLYAPDDIEDIFLV